MSATDFWNIMAWTGTLLLVTAIVGSFICGAAFLTSLPEYLRLLRDRQERLN